MLQRLVLEVEAVGPQCPASEVGQLLRGKVAFVVDPCWKTRPRRVIGFKCFVSEQLRKENKALRERENGVRVNERSRCKEEKSKWAGED